MLPTFWGDSVLVESPWGARVKDMSGYLFSGSLTDSLPIQMPYCQEMSVSVFRLQYLGVFFFCVRPIVTISLLDGAW